MKDLNENSNKIILDLCGGTAAWSKPYRDNGYDVHLVTLPDYDVRTYQPPSNVYGILAAPPCTDFAVSGARWWLQKDGNVAIIEIASLDIVLACLRIIQQSNSLFWALENPVGRLSRYLGKPRYYFQPYEYGDPWTKKTAIWGNHNIPIKSPVKPIGQWTGRADQLGIVDHLEYLPPDWVHKLPPSSDRQMLRSITPQGFARAFYEANK